MANPSVFIHGAKLYRGDKLLAAAPTYTEIQGVIEVGLPLGFDVTKIDATVQASPNKTREFIPGLVTLADIPVRIAYSHVEATQDVLRAPHTLATRVAWKIELPVVETGMVTGATFEFDGWMVLNTANVPLDDRMTLEGTVVVGSVPTFTDEAAA